MSTHEMYDERSAIRGSYSGDAVNDVSPLQEPRRGFLQMIPKRYIVSLMGFLGFVNVYMLRVNLSIAIVAMTRNRTLYVNKTNDTENGTLVYLNNTARVEVREFDWDPQLQGVVLSAFFWGYILTQLPGGWLATKIGGKYLFGGGVLGTALLTIITPPAAKVSVYLLIVVRVLEGIFEGVTFPSIHAIWAKWAPPLERSKLATTAFSGAYVGTVIAMPMSGSIANSLGWPAIFYITGALGILWYLLWSYCIVESPQHHPTISQSELEYINRSIGYNQQQVQDSSIPWKCIFMSGPVWGVVVAHFAENWGFYTLLTELPNFLSDVTNYSLFQAGFAAAGPYLAMAIMVQVGGQLADVIRSRGILSTTNTRRVFTGGAFLWQMAFMLITAFMVKASSAIACITVAVGLGGFAWAGFSVNHLDLAPQYASVLMGISNTFATIPGMISPSLTGFLTQNHTPLEWRVVFFIASTIYCVGALLYMILASGERQPWAEVPEGYEQHLDSHSEVLGDD